MENASKSKQSGTEEVDVFLGAEKVGCLRLTPQSNESIFLYTDKWMATGFALSPSLPLTNEIDDASVLAFFQNLLPEGRAFEHLCRLSIISENNIIGLVLRLRDDLSGAVRLALGGENQQQKSTIRPIAKNELLLRLTDPDRYPMDVWDGKPSVFVSGTQPKLNVLGIDGGWALSRDAKLVSDTILKFENQAYPQLLFNEYLTTQIAKAIGFEVCKMQYKRLGKYPVLEIDRFDRKKSVDEFGQSWVLRRHTIDGCQALGVASWMKYEKLEGNLDESCAEDGVSYAKLFELADYASCKMDFVINLLDWMIFNVVIGNSDAHGKNISFFVDHRGLSVAPWYDLISVLLIDKVDHSMGMRVGGERELEKVGALQLGNTVREVGLTEKLLIQRMSNLINGLRTIEFDDLLPEILTKEEHEFAERYRRFVNRQILKWENLHWF